MQDFIPEDFYTRENHTRECMRQEAGLRAWFVSQNNQRAVLDDINKIYKGEYDLIMRDGRIELQAQRHDGHGYKKIWTGTPPCVITLEKDGKLWRWPVAMFNTFHVVKRYQDIDGNR